MKHLRIQKWEKGAASSWSLIVLIALIVVLGAAVYLWFPRPQVIEPKPVVTRMKIPPMPPPEPAPPTNDEQPLMAGAETAPPQHQENAKAPAPAGEISRTAALPAPDDPSANSDASVEQIRDDSTAASPAAAGDEQLPPLPATATASPADPMVERRPTVGNAPQEEKPADNIASSPGAEETKGAMPSDQALAAAEKEKEADKNEGIEPASPRSQEQAGPSAEPAQTHDPFSVQVGVYRVRENADKVASGLKALGYASFIHESPDKRQRPLYKVCFGRFESKGEAAQAAATFREREEQPALVVRLESP